MAGLAGRRTPEDVVADGLEAIRGGGGTGGRIRENVRTASREPNPRAPEKRHVVRLKVDSRLLKKPFVGLATLPAGAAVACETVQAARGPEVARILSVDFSAAAPRTASFARPAGNERTAAGSGGPELPADLSGHRQVVPRGQGLRLPSAGGRLPRPVLPCERRAGLGPGQATPGRSRDLHDRPGRPGSPGVGSPFGRAPGRRSRPFPRIPRRSARAGAVRGGLSPGRGPGARGNSFDSPHADRPAAAPPAAGAARLRPGGTHAARAAGDAYRAALSGRPLPRPPRLRPGHGPAERCGAAPPRAWPAFPGAPWKGCPGSGFPGARFLPLHSAPFPDRPVEARRA